MLLLLKSGDIFADRAGLFTYPPVSNTGATSIDSALLRPEDTFMALGKIDSWMLGEGESRIAEWLGEKGVNRPPQLHSVLDLAKFVQSLSGVTGAR
ncbi:MAG: hypothetical protein IT484_06065 [Gammaproteobacteria bacterium]|nr:hypothetical protein [Gammaproteobacteria bacterium]